MAALAMLTEDQTITLQKDVSEEIYNNRIIKS